MLMPSIFGEDLFDDFMGYPAGRQAAANAYPQVKDCLLYTSTFKKRTMLLR